MKSHLLLSIHLWYICSCKGLLTMYWLLPIQRILRQIKRLRSDWCINEKLILERATLSHHLVLILGVNLSLVNLINVKIRSSFRFLRVGIDAVIWYLSKKIFLALNSSLKRSIERVSLLSSIEGTILIVLTVSCLTLMIRIVCRSKPSWGCDLGLRSLLVCCYSSRLVTF